MITIDKDAERKGSGITSTSPLRLQKLDPGLVSVITILIYGTTTHTHTEKTMDQEPGGLQSMGS